MKIFIPCAGIGSRLEFLTKNLNKSLVRVGDKPAISHIVEKFSSEHSFVIALGYKGDLLKQFLTLAYPEKKIEYVEVDNYDGVGSGLGLTLFSCRHLLQDPFLFIPTDSLFDEPESFLISHPDCIFFSDSFDEEFQYRKLEIANGKLKSLADKKHRGLSYTGICHIHSYQDFWQLADQSPEFISSGESYILNKLAATKEISCKKISWHDMGNLKALEQIKILYPSQYNILEKENESIWFVNDKVIKYHHDSKFIQNRVARYQQLENYVPQLLNHTNKMYSYRFVEGTTLSSIFDLKVMENLLEFLQSFWKSLIPTDSTSFQQRCYQFYHDKSFQRIKNYLAISKSDYHCVNGIEIGGIEDLLQQIDWHWLSQGIPSTYHGDLHFENILKTADGFCLLDWRQDFEGDISIGDIYYDFAKLLHGMIVAHDLIKDNQFSISYLNSDSIFFDFYLKQINVSAQEIFFEFLKQHQYDYHKVKILTALIFLNIAPLHHEPYNHLLYYLGKLQLYYALREINAA